MLAAGVSGGVHPGVVTTIRRARPEDEPGLKDIDAATWTAGVSPAPAPSAGAAFFGGRIAPADVLVAETGRVIAGFAALGQSGHLASRLLGGRYVNDVLMACMLDAAAGPPGG